VTRSERERDSDGTGARERLEALDVAAANMIYLAAANDRPGAGTIVFILPAR